MHCTACIGNLSPNPMKTVHGFGAIQSGNMHFVTIQGEAAGEHAYNIDGPNDSDFHATKSRAAG